MTHLKEHKELDKLQPGSQ